MPIFGTLVGLLLAVCAFSQTFEQTLGDLQTRNPPDRALTLVISAPALFHPAPTRFHEGELIPFMVNSTHTPPGADRIYMFSGFLLSPTADCGQLSKPCFERRVRNGLFNPDNAGLQGDLNGYVPRLKPGHYRLAALQVVEVLKQSGPLSHVYGYTEPPQYVVSNAASFEIVPATREWQRQVIAEAVKTLSDPPEYEMAQESARRLRYLGTPEAWEAALDHLDRFDYELLPGLEEAANKKAACALLEARLTEPRQFVSTNYLGTLARVCGSLEAAPMPQVDRKTAAGEKAVAEWSRQTLARETHFSDQAAAELAGHLNEKTPAMKSAAMDALMQYAANRQGNPNGTPFGQPPWPAPVRQEVIRQWPRFTAYRQRSLLEDWQWGLMRGPDMAPVLEAMTNGTLEQSGDVETWRLAIKRLDELEPAKAQARIIEDMLQPASRVDDATLALLGPEATRDLTPRLIRTLAQAQTSPRGNWHLTMEFLARFGDAGSLERMRAIYESQTEKCQPEMLAYFLRVDPRYAARMLPPPPWDMQAPAPPCAMRYFAVTARLDMSPVLEKFMTAYLMHSNVDVKMRAAESLGKYGTAEAEPALWDGLRYFHDYWKDRRGQMKDHPEGEFLEVALRNAIARGAGWLTTEADERLIASLCLTERCQYETANDLQNLRPPLTVRVEFDRASVAQYYNIGSLDALENKLGQFPAGTAFELRVVGPNREQAIERLKQFGARKGMAFR